MRQGCRCKVRVWGYLLFAVTTIVAGCSSSPSGGDGDGGPVDLTQQRELVTELDRGPADLAAADFRDAGLPDAAVKNCVACHGSGTNSAPPKDVSGKSATTLRGVGAHQQHLGSSTWRAPVTCDHCHLVPKKVTDKGHIDTALPAEVTFFGLALANKAKPGWNGTACGGSYCHGATLSGGNATAPVWTKVDGTQAACGSCHGMPPNKKGHPASAKCSMCHDKVVDQNNKIIAPALHINGKLEAVNVSACHACHGSKVNAAPPLSLAGKSATSLRGVGAHQKHLGSSTWRAAISCTSCHLVPKALGDKGHIDSAAPAEVTFSGLANADGAKPKWTGTSCQGSYCHGATLSGGGATAPVWTKVDGSQTKCSGCHGLPPTKNNHPASAACYGCHKAVVAKQLKIIAPALHIDGKVTSNLVSGSHTIHTDKNDPRGPGITCVDCHAAGKYPYFKAGKDANGDGKYNLAETTVCDACHSPKGSYNGVKSTAGSVGAKDLWAAQVYSKGVLKPGNEKWCAGCHDEQPAVINKVKAPNIIGDQGAMTAWGKGYGFYRTGHGLPSTAGYPASGGSVAGAGLACGRCHDNTSKHIDGVARTYQYKAAAGSSADFQHGYRLKSVGGNAPLQVPRQNGCASGVKASDFRLCLGCHPAAPFTSASNLKTNFRKHGSKNAHYYHLAIAYKCGPGPVYTSDWRSHNDDSQATCVTCHNVHGSTQLSMVRDGKLVGRTPGLQVSYYNAGVTYQCGGPGSHYPTPANVTLPKSTGTVWRASTKPLCRGCHGGCGFNSRYMRAAVDASPPFIHGVYGRVGSNKLAVLLSEASYTNASGAGALVAGDFKLVDLDNSRLVVGLSHAAGGRLAILTLSSNVDGSADLRTDTLAARPTAIFDAAANAMSTAATTLAADTDPPVASKLFPSAKSTGVNTGSKVSFTLADARSGVQWSSLSVKLSGSLGYAKTYTHLSSGVVSKTGAPWSYQMALKPASFSPGETITVSVTAADALGNAMSAVSWSFTVAP